MRQPFPAAQPRAGMRHNAHPGELSYNSSRLISAGSAVEKEVHHIAIGDGVSLALSP